MIDKGFGMEFWDFDPYVLNNCIRIRKLITIIELVVKMPKIAGFR